MVTWLKKVQCKSNKWITQDTWVHVQKPFPMNVIYGALSFANEVNEPHQINIQRFVAKHKLYQNKSLYRVSYSTIPLLFKFNYYGYIVNKNANYFLGVMVHLLVSFFTVFFEIIDSHLPAGGVVSVAAIFFCLR